jgi:signal transduction histidine kinase
MKLGVALLSVLFLSKPGFAQTAYADTLKNRVRLSSTPDKEKILLYSSLAAITAFKRPDSAMEYVQKGMHLARKIGYTKGEMYNTFSFGITMWLAGDYSRANELLQKSLKYAKSNSDTGWQIDIIKVLSANSREQGTYDEALKYSYEATALAKQSRQTEDNLMLCYLEIGAAYAELNKPDSAIYYLQQVNLKNEPGYTGFKFLMIGKAYAKAGKDSLALKYFTLSTKILPSSNNYKDFASAYSSIAVLYVKKGKPDSAIMYAEKGFDIAQNASFKKGIFENGTLLSRLYETKDAIKALAYFKTAMAAKDSMFNMQIALQSLNSEFNEQMQAQKEQADKVSYQNKIRTYVLLAALIFFLLLIIILYRNNTHRQRAKIKIEKAYEQLKSTQAQLIHSEKMASLGELTAGIAHEIQNPLNFVNNFSEVNKEMIVELKEAIDKGNYEEVKLIATDIEDNEEKINHHGKRADSIVKGMLQHSRTSVAQKEPTEINAIADEYLRLAYHGMRAKDKSFNAEIKTDFDKSIEKINIVPQDIGRVLLNLYNNALYAVNEKMKLQQENYTPTVSVSTKKIGNKIEVIVKDSGNGISQKVIDKIFQPFFTTKPTGQGTGLGLSLAYDIIKSHGGEIKVNTQEGEGSEFKIILNS